MSDKFDKFSKDLEILCKKYSVFIFVSVTDDIEVWDLDDEEYFNDSMAELVDMTEESNNLNN